MIQANPRHTIAPLIIAVIAMVLWLWTPGGGAPKQYYKNEGLIFGTYYNVQYENSRDLHAEVKQALQDFDNSLSMFNPRSVMAAVNDNRDTIVDAFFEQMFNEAKAVNELSNGAFDITVAPFVNYWGFGRTQNTDRCTDRIQSTDIFPVKEFKEKPNLETAKKYLESGDYLWNSGIFVWSLETICKAIDAYLPEVAEIFRKGEGVIGTKGERAFIEENFPKCPNISVDYGIMEKADNVFVLPSSFGWSDLGTWGSLYELSEKDEQGNVSLHSDAMFYEAKGNVVTLEKGKLAVVQGVDDMIIAEQENVLLVCKKADEQRIKEFVANVKEPFK